MKRFFKALALVLALALVIGTIPVSAAETESSTFEMIKGKYDWRIYLGGAHGEKTDENGQVVTDTTKDRFKVTKKVLGFDPETMNITLESANEAIATTSNKKDKIYAKSIGTTKVTINVLNKKTKDAIGKLEIDVIVKKNAESVPVIIKDAEGKEPEKFGVNVPYTFTLTRRELEDVNENGKLDLTDTDKRKLICVDANGNTVDSVQIEQPDTKKPIYVVTFTAAGDFTLKAQAYQSASWPGILKETEIKCNAGYTALALRQKNLDTVAVTFDTKVAGLAPANFAAYYKVYDTKAQKDVDVLFSEVYTVNADPADENIANIKWYSRFEYGQTYYIAYGKDSDGNPNFIGQFTAATVTDASVARIEIVPGQVFSKSDADKLEYYFYDKDDVDITEADELYRGLDPVFEFEKIPEDDFNSTIQYNDVHDVEIMLDVLGVYKVKATYIYYDNNSVEVPVVGIGDVECKKVAWDRGVIAGFVDSPKNGIKATLTSHFITGAMSYHTDWASDTWAMGDGDAYLSIAVPYTKKGVTIYEGFGHTVDEVENPATHLTMEGPKEFEDYTIQTSNENIVIVSEDQGNAKDYGYYKITANQVGSCLLIVKGIYTDDNFNKVEKAIGTVRVEVKPERKVTTFNVTKDNAKLNIAYKFDSVTYSLGIVDQYGDALAMGTADNEYGTYTVKQIGKLDTAVVRNFYSDAGESWDVYSSAPIVTLEADGTQKDLTNTKLRVWPESFVAGTVALDKQYPVRFEFVFKDKTGKEFKASVPQFVVGNENEAKKYELIMSLGNNMDTAVYADTWAPDYQLGLIGKTKSNFNFYGPNYLIGKQQGNLVETRYDSTNLHFEERKLNDLKWSLYDSNGALIPNLTADKVIGDKITLPTATGEAMRFVYNVMYDNKYIDEATINAKGDHFDKDDNTFVSAVNVSGSAVKFKSGTYRITAYQVVKSNSENGIKTNKISQISFVVTDSQSKPIVTKLSEGERINSVQGNEVLEAFSVYLPHTKGGVGVSFYYDYDISQAITNPIAGYELNFDTNLDEPETTAYVKSATVTITNAHGLGKLDVTTTVDKIVKEKKH